MREVAGCEAGFGEADFAVASDFAVFFVLGVFDGDEACAGHGAENGIEIIARHAAGGIQDFVASVPAAL